MKLVFAAAVALALIGAGCGYLAGYFPLFSTSAGEGTAMTGKERQDSKKEDGVKADVGSEDGGHSTAEGTEAATDGKHLANNVYPLDPIVTNIAMPADVWVRFEAVIKAREPLEEDVPQQIHQDILAFLHSMRLSELTGSSAFIDLKAELLARANTRSNGKVEAIYIKTFLFE